MFASVFGRWEPKSHEMAGLRGFFRPVTETEPRPDPVTDPTGAAYVRSFLWLRVLIGIAGVLLPVVLVLVDWLWFNGSPVPRDSESAYYYSGVRDVFVGVLFATSAFLLVYKIGEVNLENLASVVAGISAGAIALFPTLPPTDDVRPPLPPPTPLQQELGITAVKAVHYAASGAFILMLIVLSIMFGIREGRRPRRPGKCSPAFWRAFHFGCSAAMVAGAIWIVATSGGAGPRWSLLLGEWVNGWAFGLSWLAKGAELDMLFGKTPFTPAD